MRATSRLALLSLVSLGMDGWPLGGPADLVHAPRRRVSSKTVKVRNPAADADVIAKAEAKRQRKNAKRKGLQ